MFTGEYHHTIDAKNRLAIPSDIRDKVNTKIEGKGFFITIGLDGCLFMYTPKEWQNIVQKINQLPFTNEKARQFQRLFFSKAQEIQDIIPQDLNLFHKN